MDAEMFQVHTHHGILPLVLDAAFAQSNHGSQFIHTHINESTAPKGEATRG